MRADTLLELLPGYVFEVADTLIPFRQTSRLLRSLGFRFKCGPLVARINRMVLACAQQQSYEAIWVDKGVFLTRETLKTLRSKTGLLIHYTPDAAWYANRSRHFERGMDLYDFLITTKSFEMDWYLSRVPRGKVLLTTQGFDPQVHYPRVPFQDKVPCITFIGLCEPAREKLVALLLCSGLEVHLGGTGWTSFVHEHASENLVYLGERVMHDAYAHEISRSFFALGCLSKRFPELHTTRTFEIPACGTALVTELNEETRRFFSPQQAVFYDSPESLTQQLCYYLEHPSELEQLTIMGHQRVTLSGYDYPSILKSLLKAVHLHP